MIWLDNNNQKKTPKVKAETVSLNSKLSMNNHPR